MKALLLLATLLSLMVATGCAPKEEAVEPPKVENQTLDAKTSNSGDTPQASSLGFQENPNGTNPGLGSK